MADTEIFERSTGLAMIRPISLEPCHIQKLAVRWRDCPCCREPLENRAVQMRCCSTILHLSCVRGFAEARASICEQEDGHWHDFYCPWCSHSLDCGSSDVCAHLEESAISHVLEAGEYLDGWLALLSKLQKSARSKFMELAEFYDLVSSDPAKCIRLPAKVHAVRKLCYSDNLAMEAFDALYKDRRISFGAILEWREWLLWDSDLENNIYLVNAQTIYGDGPNRFKPRLVDRLRLG